MQQCERGLTCIAAPLVLGRFINVVSRCFFGLEASCMNNLAAGSTDVNQALGRLGHMIVGSPTGLEKCRLHIYCSNVFLTTWLFKVEFVKNSYEEEFMFINIK